MPKVYDLPVYMKYEGTDPADWRDMEEPDDHDLDDDEDLPARPEVAAVLGFDPDDLDDIDAPEETARFNPHHGADGKFSSADDAASSSPMSKEQIDRHYPAANEGGKDTQGRFKRADGSYTPERQGLHDRIRQAILKESGDPQPQEHPVAFMLGGGTASGKSSAIKAGAVRPPESAVQIDADHIKSKIPEYQRGMADKWSGAAYHVHEESSDVAKQLLADAAGNKKNLLLDGTGDNSADSIQKKTDMLHAHGFRVEASYLTVDTKTAIERSNARAAKTGRVVPEEVIRQIHAGVSKVLPECVRRGLFDHVELWDNNGDKPVKIMEADGTHMQVHDAARYQQFLDKANEK